MRRKRRDVRRERREVRGERQDVRRKRAIVKLTTGERGRARTRRGGVGKGSHLGGWVERQGTHGLITE